ncbi:MAG: hypothetical protein GTO03_00565, partial [Planctomycetales bacterium]|nr:hypothetical protein [Planctomycetales bacterium]
MNAEDLKARLQEDIELAKKVGVDATPAVFVAGRRVPRIALQRMHYWKMVAKNFQVALQRKQAQ